MDGITTNAVLTEAAKAVLLGNLKPDSPVFLAIDTVLALVAILVMPFLLRGVLRLLAPHEADDSFLKVFFVTQLFVVTASMVAIVPLSGWRLAGVAVLSLCGAVFMVKVLCWLRFKRAALVTVAILCVWGGLGAGGLWIENYLLPPGRITLADQVKKSLGVIDEFAGKEGAPVFGKNTLHNMKMGMTLEAEALVGALHLLKHPEAIQEMTEDHTADLKALDLLGDGKMPSPEELKELGITEEEVTEKRQIIQRLSFDEEIDEKDVEKLALFIRSVRKTDEPLTADDIARILREVKQRSGPTVAALAAAAQSGTNTPADIATILAGAVAGGETNEQFVGPPRPAELPVTALATSAVAVVKPPVYVDPLKRMSPRERSAWLDAEVLLKTTGLMKKSSEKVALVNGESVRTGEVVWVESGGRSFAWRLRDVQNFRAQWEAAPELCSRDGGQ